MSGPTIRVVVVVGGRVVVVALATVVVGAGWVVVGEPPAVVVGAWVVVVAGVDSPFFMNRTVT